MSEWLEKVVAEKGEKCGNCGTWRALHGKEIDPEINDVDDGYIEECSNCGDDGYDIYAVDDINRMMRNL